MIITALVLAFLGAGAGAAAAATVVRWDDIRGWASSLRNARSLRLIRRSIATGDVQIVSIGLTATGQRIASRTDTARGLDPSLTARFGAANTITVRL
jgi:uncharacterized membrane protein YqgA involved in biofilm formation